jgi:hypothetical protein
MADLKISVDMSDIPAAVQATRRFERQIDDLAGRLARGAITSGTYQKALNQLSGQYRRLGVDINTARSNIMTYGRAAAEAAREQQALLTATQASTRGINRSGLVMQQTGYQVGDFLVQVQSGTNAMVAFGQQATQMAGLLTLSVNPRVIALGAALSIGIPLVTAIGAAFMRTSGQSKSFADSLEEASQSVSALKDAIDILRLDSLDELTRAYGEVNQELRDFLTLSAEALRLQAIEDVVGSFSRLRDELRGIFSTETTSLQNIFNINLGQANQLVASMQRAVEATDLESQLRFVVELRQRILAVTNGVEEMTSEQRQFFLQVVEAEDGLRRALNVANSVSSALAEGATNAALMAQQLNAIRVFQQQIMQPSGGRGGDPRAFGAPGQGFDFRDFDTSGAEAFLAGPSTGGGGSGGGAAREQEDYLLNLQREADLKLQMIGLSEEEQRRLEITNELINRNLPVEDERIQKLIATEAALRQAMEAEERREQLMNSIQGNLESGFMAMIDGSKSVEDAFKSMIRAILVDIAQQAIVKPIATGITSFLFPGRASGGSMMAGNPYIVGENGPELVIPSRGSTVANANLTSNAVGGGAPVVINQTFQFSANGDDSVKRIIAAEAPKIAALTQKQIVDQRRRGGQMRNVFG